MSKSVYISPEENVTSKVGFEQSLPGLLRLPKPRDTTHKCLDVPVKPC